MRSNKIFIFDTSILCCWLKVPGKETCGPSEDRWDHDRINKLVKAEEESGATFVLPVASIIETGNHIAFSSGNKHELAVSLSDSIRKSASETTPWAAFSEQSDLWRSDKLIELADEWPLLAVQGLGIGDFTIKGVADFYASTGSYEIIILTGDKGLKAYEPPAPKIIPRRRSSRN